MNHVALIQCFEHADTSITGWEQSLQVGAVPSLPVLVDEASLLVKQMIIAYMNDMGNEPPAVGEDLLEVFKALVKGDPSWNTIRDNCRELVYYKNCLLMDRADALPAKPETMAIRTVRHIFLFMKTRAIREARLEMA